MRSVHDDPDGYMRGELWWQQVRSYAPPCAFCYFRANGERPRETSLATCAEHAIRTHPDVVAFFGEAS